MPAPPALRMVTARLCGGPYHGRTYEVPESMNVLTVDGPQGQLAYTRHTLVFALPHECVVGIRTTRVWYTYTRPDFPRDEARARLVASGMREGESEPGDWLAPHLLLLPIEAEVKAGQWRLPSGVIELDAIHDRAWRHSVAREFEEMLEAMEHDDSE